MTSPITLLKCMLIKHNVKKFCEHTTKELHDVLDEVANLDMSKATLDESLKLEMICETIKAEDNRLNQLLNALNDNDFNMATVLANIVSNIHCELCNLIIDFYQERSYHGTNTHA